MHLFKYGFLVTFMILSLPSLARSKNIYRDCGIGALIFPKTGWAAVTSNIIWDWGITASTTTTSSEDQCAGKAASAAQFIYQNYAIIEEETATGQGAHLATMLNILGCSHESHDKIMNAVRSSFSKSILNKKYSNKNEKAENYFNNVMETVEGNYSIQCQTS